MTNRPEGADADRNDRNESGVSDDARVLPSSAAAASSDGAAAYRPGRQGTGRASARIRLDILGIGDTGIADTSSVSNAEPPDAARAAADDDTPAETAPPPAPAPEDEPTATREDSLRPLEDASPESEALLLPSSPPAPLPLAPPSPGGEPASDENPAALSPSPIPPQPRRSAAPPSTAGRTADVTPEPAQADEMAAEYAAPAEPRRRRASGPRPRLELPGDAAFPRPPDAQSARPAWGEEQPTTDAGSAPPLPRAPWRPAGLGAAPPAGEAGRSWRDLSSPPGFDEELLPLSLPSLPPPGVGPPRERSESAEGFPPAASAAAVQTAAAPGRAEIRSGAAEETDGGGEPIGAGESAEWQDGTGTTGAADGDSIGGDVPPVPEAAAGAASGSADRTGGEGGAAQTTSAGPAADTGGGADAPSAAAPVLAGRDNPPRPLALLFPTALLFGLPYVAAMTAVEAGLFGRIGGWREWGISGAVAILLWGGVFTTLQRAWQYPDLLADWFIDLHNNLTRRTGIAGQDRAALSACVSLALLGALVSPWLFFLGAAVAAGFFGLVRQPVVLWPVGYEPPPLRAPEEPPLEEDALRQERLLLRWTLEKGARGVGGTRRSQPPWQIPVVVDVARAETVAAEIARRLPSDDPQQAIRRLMEEGSTDEIIQLAAGLRAIQARERLTDYEDLANALSLIHQALETETPSARPWRSPVETLRARRGTSADLSVLLAALLRQLGRPCLILYDRERDHMAVAGAGAEGYPRELRFVPDPRGAPRRYFYCETTERDWLPGEVPASVNIEQYVTYVVPTLYETT